MRCHALKWSPGCDQCWEAAHGTHRRNGCCPHTRCPACTHSAGRGPYRNERHSGYSPTCCRRGWRRNTGSSPRPGRRRWCRRRELSGIPRRRCMKPGSQTTPSNSRRSAPLRIRTSSACRRHSGARNNQRCCRRRIPHHLQRHHGHHHSCCCRNPETAQSAAGRVRDPRHSLNIGPHLQCHRCRKPGLQRWRCTLSTLHSWDPRDHPSSNGCRRSRPPWCRTLLSRVCR